MPGGKAGEWSAKPKGGICQNFRGKTDGKVRIVLDQHFGAFAAVKGPTFKIAGTVNMLKMRKRIPKVHKAFQIRDVVI